MFREAVTAVPAADDPALLEAWQTLADLQDSRFIADYRLAKPIDVETARRAVGFAEAIFAAA
jgi:hypothetical protein